MTFAMQSLKNNIKNGLITLGVIVALLAVLLTPGFFSFVNGSFIDTTQVNESTELLSGRVLERSADAVFGLIKKTSLK